MTAFLKAMARQGAVGVAARWAAHRYQFYMCLAPDEPVTIDSIVAALIAARYDVDALVCPLGRSPGIRAALGTLREAGGIHGICHLVVLILTAETDFLGLPPGVKTESIEVIGSELAALGVPGEHAFGDDPGGCPESLCCAYLPSIQLLGLLLRE
ncbi:MAG: hypothetical protein OXP09_00590 [Gammaproteobacteria bacterium]|nr:hypothetical protein [Rhodospirillaceae bacterium]MDE0364050.1 hypothetical protein [Gammaproteobacteria bacterium]